MQLTDDRTFGNAELLQIVEAIQPVIRAEVAKYRPQILASKKRQQAELRAAIQRRRDRTLSALRSQQPDVSNYVARVDDRPAQITQYQRKDRTMPATANLREKAAKLASDRTLQKRSKGETAHFADELDVATRELGAPAGATHYAKSKAITAPTPQPGRRHRACVLAREEDMRLRKLGRPSDLERLADEFEMKLAAEEGVMRYAAPKPAPSGGPPWRYKTLFVMAQEIAARRLGSDSSDSARLSAETQKVIRELLEANAAKKTGKAVLVYSPDPIEMHLANVALGSMSEQSCDLADQQFNAKRGRGEATTYADELRLADEVVRERTYRDLKRSIVGFE